MYVVRLLEVRVCKVNARRITKNSIVSDHVVSNIDLRFGAHVKKRDVSSHSVVMWHRIQRADRHKCRIVQLCLRSLFIVDLYNCRFINNFYLFSNDYIKFVSKTIVSSMRVCGLMLIYKLVCAWFHKGLLHWSGHCTRHTC